MTLLGNVPSKCREFVYNNLILIIVDTSNELVTCKSCISTELDEVLKTFDVTMIYVEDTNDVYLRDAKVIVDTVTSKNDNNSELYEHFDESKPLNIKYRPSGV